MVQKRTCDYTGEDIEPGTGTMFVKNDGSILWFKDSKAKKNYRMGREARDLEWIGYEEDEESEAVEETDAAEEETAVAEETADAEADDEESGAVDEETDDDEDSDADDVDEEAEESDDVTEEETEAEA